MMHIYGQKQRNCKYHILKGDSSPLKMQRHRTQQKESPYGLYSRIIHLLNKVIVQIVNITYNNMHKYLQSRLTL